MYLILNKKAREMDFNYQKIIDEIKLENEQKKLLFTKDFQVSLYHFIYGCSGLELVANKSNADFLFKKFNTEFNINPIFQFLETETIAENMRYGNTTFAVYSFNENYINKTPIRIDIRNKKIAIPEHLKKVTKYGKKPRACVDIEFFEKTSLLEDSKNEELKDFIKNYLVNGSWTRIELEELGNLKALEDLEKIHTKFLIFEDESIIPIYLGIGNNQPYNISEKSNVYGKNRFYRYDISCIGNQFYEQMSRVNSGEIMDFSDQDYIAPEMTCDGTLFTLHFKKGIAILNGKIWKKAVLDQQFEHLILNDEIKKNRNLNFLKEKIISVFPDFDRYSQVFYDPLERTNSYSHLKTIKFLKKKGLLGQGWQAKINVASDLYLNGHDPVLRMKPSLILIYHLIDTGKFNELIINTSKNIQTAPIDNII